MSYEHCDIHDCDATNGCPTCTALAFAAEARDAIEPALEAFRKRLDILIQMNDYTAHLLHPLELEAEKLALAAFHLGRNYTP